MFGGYSIQVRKKWDRLVQLGEEKALGMRGATCRLSLPKGDCYGGGGVRPFPGVHSDRARGNRHRLQQEQFLLGRKLLTAGTVKQGSR